MVEYHAYFVEDGHFKKSVVLFGPDDNVAKERAEQLADGFDIELWQLGRKVATFKRKPK